MKVKVDDSNVRMTFDAAKYVIAGALVALSLLLIGWLLACIAGSAGAEEPGMWGFIAGLKVSFAMLIAFIAFIDDNVTVYSLTIHMLKIALLAAGVILIPALFIVMFMGMFGKTGMLVAIFLLLGGGFDLIGYFNSSDYKKECK